MVSEKWRRTNGDYIYIICKEEDQIQPVMKRMTTDTCYLSDYEEWDEDEDMKWILTFKVLEDFDQLPEKNWGSKNDLYWII